MRDDLGNRGRAYAQAISIHVPRMRDDSRLVSSENSASFISIHVPRMRDDNLDLLCQELINISIHVPRMRDDIYPLRVACHYYNFNPRPSHEGRPLLDSSAVRTFDFNPRPSHEGRLLV